MRKLKKINRSTQQLIVFNLIYRLQMNLIQILKFGKKLMYINMFSIHIIIINKIKKVMNQKQSQKNQVKEQKLQSQNLNHQNDEKTEEQQQNYYNEYCKLHLANVVLTTQLKELNFEKTQLISKLLKLEKKAQELSDGNSGQVDEKKRRIRRAASQIARHYKCMIQGCSKSYGSEGSLNQHIKIKHPQVFKSMGHYGNSIVKQSHEQDSS